MKRLIPVGLVAVAVLSACATSPTGRSQLILVDNAQVAQMGATAFDELRKQGKFASAPGQQRYARCVADALISVLPPPWSRQQWDVRIIDDDSANAFALPGGKIGVNRGMFKVATDENQLATVLGHELAHVVAHHPAERVSDKFAAQAAASALAAYGATKGYDGQQVMGLLGLGAEVGVLLPFSRTQESEADTLGQRYMAEAGFNPASAVTLWQKMETRGGSRPPAFLSTHPAPGARAQHLAQEARQLQPIYQQARDKGRTPDCHM